MVIKFKGKEEGRGYGGVCVGCSYGIVVEMWVDLRGGGEIGRRKMMVEEKELKVEVVVEVMMKEERRMDTEDWLEEEGDVRDGSGDQLSRREGEIERGRRRNWKRSIGSGVTWLEYGRGSPPGVVGGCARGEKAHVVVVGPLEEK